MRTVFSRVRHVGLSLPNVLVAVGSLACALALAASGVAVRRHLLAELGVPDRGAPLVVVWEQDSSKPDERKTLSAANAADVLGSGVFADGGFALSLSDVLTVSGRSDLVDVAAVTDNAFDLIPARVSLGRRITRGDATRAERVCVISQRLWRSRFAADPSAIGQVVSVGSRVLHVVGVMAADVRFPYPLVDVSPDIWIAASPLAGTLSRRFNGYLVLGSCAQSFDACRSRLGVLTQRLQVEFPPTNQHIGLWPQRTSDAALAPYSRTLRLVLFLAGLVLVLALATFAQALETERLTRSTAMAVKRALGASERRLWLEEVARVTLVAGLAAALGSVATIALLRSGVVTTGWLGLGPADVRVGWWVLPLGSVTLWLLAVLTTLPPFFSPPANLVGELTGTRVLPRMRWAQHAQTVVQLCFAVAVVALAVSTALAYRTAIGGERGRYTAGLVNTRIELPNAGYGDNESRLRFLRDLTSQLEQLPGVVSVAALDKIRPADVGQSAIKVSTGQELLSDVFLASHSAATTLGLTLIAGQWLPEHSVPDSPAVVVNDAFARELGGPLQALGRTVTVPGRGRAPYSIAGVIGNADHFNPTRWQRPQMYLPLELRAQNRLSIVVRSSDGAVPAREIAEAIRHVEPAALVVEQRTFDEMRATSAWPAAAQVRSLLGLSVTAIALAVFGIVGGTIARACARGKELALRSVLGASRLRLLRDVIGQSLISVAIGSVAGIAVAAWSAQTVRALVYGFASVSPAITVLVGLAIAALAAACAVAAALHVQVSWRSLNQA